MHKKAVANTWYSAEKLPRLLVNLLRIFSLKTFWHLHSTFSFFGLKLEPRLEGEEGGNQHTLLAVTRVAFF